MGADFSRELERQQAQERESRYMTLITILVLLFGVIITVMLIYNGMLIELLAFLMNAFSVH